MCKLFLIHLLNVIASDTGSLSSSPVTPSSAEDQQQHSQSKVFDKKKRQIINQRKIAISNLFQKCGYFPSPKDLDEFLVIHN